jgi:hypothetical protein
MLYVGKQILIKLRLNVSRHHLNEKSVIEAKRNDEVSVKNVIALFSNCTSAIYYIQAYKYIISVNVKPGV